MHNRQPSSPPVRLLSSRQVADQLGIHHKTFLRYRREKSLREFPEPVSLGPGAHRWRSDLIEEWIRQLSPGGSAA